MPSHSGRLLFAIALVSTPLSAVPEPPRLISPTETRESRIGALCPSFSWTLVASAQQYTVVVYAVAEGGGARRSPDAPPILNIDLPQGATAWTPALDECLPGVGRYGWSVGAKLDNGQVLWSRPGVFRVADPSGERPRETRHAVASAGQQPSRSLAPAAGATGGLESGAGASFSPPPCGTTFTDTAGHPLCGWIEQLAADKISLGCGGGKYCPDNAVTRAQMALFLGRALHGTDTWQIEQGGGGPDPPVPAQNQITLIDTTNDVGSYNSITIGADGLGLISYYDATAGNLKVAHCSNVECSSTTISTLDQTGVVGQYNSITVGADGLGLISYYAATGGDLKVAHCSNVTCTTANVTNLDTPSSPFDQIGLWTSITTVYPGVGRILYYNDSFDRIRIATCANVQCTSATIATPINIVSNAALAIAGGATGITMLAFLVDPHLVVAACTSDCSDPAEEFVFPYDPEPGDVDGHIAMVVGSDGNPLVAYQNNGGLQVSHCAEPAQCYAPDSIETQIDVTSLAEGMSMAVGADGLAVIAHAGTGLDFVHCENVECTQSTTNTLFGIDARAPSVTIGSDGLPLISFYESGGNNQLRVIHCANVRCNPFFRRR